MSTNWREPFEGTAITGDDTDWRSPVTKQRHKENNYCPYAFLGRALESNRKARFFANGRYATGQYKEWLEKDNDFSDWNYKKPKADPIKFKKNGSAKEDI